MNAARGKRTFQNPPSEHLDSFSFPRHSGILAVIAPWWSKRKVEKGDQTVTFCDLKIFFSKFSFQTFTWDPNICFCLSKSWSDYKIST